MPNILGISPSSRVLRKTSQRETSSYKPDLASVRGLTAREKSDLVKNGRTIFLWLAKVKAFGASVLVQGESDFSEPKESPSVAL